MAPDPSGRDAALARALKQIDEFFRAGAYSLATEALAHAERDFPGDEQLAGRRTVLNIAAGLGPVAEGETLVKPRRAADRAPDRPQVTPHKSLPGSVWWDEQADPNDKTVVLTKAARDRLVADAKLASPDPPPILIPGEPESESTGVITREDRDRVARPRQPLEPSPVLTGPASDATVLMGRSDRSTAAVSKNPGSKDPVLRRTATAAPPKPPKSRRPTGTLWPLWIALGAAIIIVGAIGFALYGGSGPIAKDASDQPSPTPTAPVTTQQTIPPSPPPPETPQVTTPPVTTTPIDPPIATVNPRSNPLRPPPPKPTPSRGPEPRPTVRPAPTSSRLTLSLDAGTRVLLDDAPIGTVGADGSFAYENVAPGSHRLTFTRDGFESVNVTKVFAAGVTVALTRSDVSLKAVPGTLVLNAEADTQLAIKQGGSTVASERGSKRFPLAPGTYEVVAKGPAGVESTESVTVTSGGTTTRDIRVVSGMEGFVGWSLADNWYTKRGGDFVTYQRSNGDGHYFFTIKLGRGGNPFSTGSALKFAIGDIASSNYVLFELKRTNLKLTEYVAGKKPSESDVPRFNIQTDGVASLNIDIQVHGSRLVIQYQAPDGWKPILNWDRAPTPATRKFAFNLPGSEQVSISQFLFYPPPK